MWKNPSRQSHCRRIERFLLWSIGSGISRGRIRRERGTSEDIV
eukprot:CCRYP_015401-RH/>CCRYP_015401-RH protein AED:0.48 eAED:1.00 QI:0/-1/0/1/-1/0/1/0/42